MRDAPETKKRARERALAPHSRRKKSARAQINDLGFPAISVHGCYNIVGTIVFGRPLFICEAMHDRDPVV
mgnify:CR=1 FL=1